MSSKITRRGFIRGAIKIAAVVYAAPSIAAQLADEAVRPTRPMPQGWGTDRYEAVVRQMEAQMWAPPSRGVISDRIFLENPQLTDEFREQLEARFHVTTINIDPDALTERQDQEPPDA